MTRICRVAEVAAHVVPHRWGWAAANRAAIAAHWERRTAERPALFNGRVLMLADWRVDRGRCDARFFETDYADMTAWLDLGRPGEPVRNGFAMGALRCADGGFVLGRMAAHTANAGQLYFPAGTPDPSDVDAHGAVDLAGSLLREIAEETGLDAAECAVAPSWTIVEEDGRTAFMRVVRLVAASGAVRERIRRFLARETRPELADVEIVSSPSELDRSAVPGVVTAFLEGVWSGQIE